MNTSRDHLSEVLQSWRVKAPAEPGFRAAVWRRIERPGELTWAAYLRAHTVAWVFAAVLAVGAAGFAGRALAQARLQADREAMAVTYLIGLDPRVQAVLKP
ncbi:MAG TPA: hypothetical protein VFJ90_08355 [Candidatus Didemnitutus sp.]|nr:hypothetical protein [Candidatus Didemnitutus sp.]